MPEVKVKFFVVFLQITIGNSLNRAVVLNRSFKRFPGQVQAFKFRIVDFKFGHNLQRLDVVIKAAEFFHGVLQAALAGMAERRMSEVMCQRDGFAKFFVQSQTFADGARNLRNFNAVRQPRTVVFAFVIGENLRFAVQPAESRRMNQPVSVALKRRTDNVGKIGIETPAAFFGLKCISCQFNIFCLPFNILSYILNRQN